MQLTIEVNFKSLKPGSDETRIMYTRSDNIEIIFGDDNDDVIEQLFESLLKKYEENLQNKMRGSEFEFDGVNFLYYDFNKTSISRGGSYINAPKWLKDKKSTINPKTNDDKCFQYAVTLALNLDKIQKDPQGVSKIKPFIEKYNWEDIDFPSTSKDWKKFECNNEVALNILYVPYNTKKINIAYKSKNNLTQERQIILLMISDGQKWHYLVVKNLSGLLRGITSNHQGDFYCLNCFHSYRTENKLEAHKKICETHDYCHVEMPTKNKNNIIKYNHGEKSMKLPFVIYADLECLLEKMSTCIYSPNESTTTKINKHTPLGYYVGVYPYEYMDNWERFNETSLPSKESFYSNLNMENIEVIDFRHFNNVFNKFKLNNLGDYHDLHVQSDTLLLADVFENFRNMCLKEYELDPAHFLSLPGLAWQGV